jgi:hypothetical protein
VLTLPDDSPDIQARVPREQVNTRDATTREIVGSPEFAQGLDEARNEFPFNARNDSWEYERGRLFAFIAPLDMPLRIGRALNPKAVKLAELAFSRKLLI